jgi:hypothetical protein
MVSWWRGAKAARRVWVAEYDRAVLSGHVVRVITDDRALVAAIDAVRRSLRPGGRLAFDSRNPHHSLLEAVDAGSNQ